MNEHSLDLGTEVLEYKKKGRWVDRPANPNFLFDIYIIIAAFHDIFRKMVCTECGWSVPTFYRKMRTWKKNPDGKARKIIGLSNAEKLMILNVIYRLIAFLRAEADKLKMTMGEQA